MVRLLCSSVLIQRTEVPQGFCSEGIEPSICFRRGVLWTGLPGPGVGGIPPGVDRIEVRMATRPQCTVLVRSVNMNASSCMAEPCI